MSQNLTVIEAVRRMGVPGFTVHRVLPVTQACCRESAALAFDDMANYTGGFFRCRYCRAELLALPDPPTAGVATPTEAKEGER